MFYWSTHNHEWDLPRTQSNELRYISCRVEIRSAIADYNEFRWHDKRELQPNTSMAVFPALKETDLATLDKWKVTKSASLQYICQKCHLCPYASQYGFKAF